MTHFYFNILDLKYICQLPNHSTINNVIIYINNLLWNFHGLLDRLSWKRSVIIMFYNKIYERIYLVNIEVLLYIHFVITQNHANFNKATTKLILSNNRHYTWCAKLLRKLLTTHSLSLLFEFDINFPETSKGNWFAIFVNVNL